MGDSHHGYTVMATNNDFYTYFSYADNQKLMLLHGEKAHDMFDVVLGAEVAKKLGYKVGDEIVISHGGGEVSFVHHDNMPFHVSGILKQTHTPIDQTLIISLKGMEAMHLDFEGGHEGHHHEHTTPRMAKAMQVMPETISAVFVGLESKQAVLGIQRSINESKNEALTAIIPTLALQELWEFFSVAEVALSIVASFVVLVGLLGMLSIILMSLNERRREMAILRSVGARPVHIFGLIVGEAAFVSALGIILGIVLLYITVYLLKAPLASEYGFYLELKLLSMYDLGLLALIESAAILISFIPGYLIYRYSLSDGMNIKF